MWCIVTTNEPTQVHVRFTEVCPFCRFPWLLPNQDPTHDVAFHRRVTLGSSWLWRLLRLPLVWMTLTVWKRTVQSFVECPLIGTFFSWLNGAVGAGVGGPQRWGGLLIPSYLAAHSQQDLSLGRWPCSPGGGVLGQASPLWLLVSLLNSGVCSSGDLLMGHRRF